MKAKSPPKGAKPLGEEERPTLEPRRIYTPPKVSKKRSVARVTLFSGGGVTAGGLTASG